ncbi:MAG: response regulator [Pseudomonadota bacterium]|nr:response regulator [Pseudomonadota bacterium]
MVVFERAVKVLLIDDEPAILANLEAYFEDEGFEILKTGNGEEAVATIAKESVDVVIVDMRLSGINGNEVMRQALADGAKCKFIIHTGSNEYRVPDDLAALGVSMDNVYLKPIKDMAVLVRAVRALVSG